ncbi:MAG: Bax inhibitor-1/YccA family protein [Fidelibacterota bacterium]
MNRHLSLRSGNPALRANTFETLNPTLGATMTILGTVHKTALSLVLLMTTALFTWNLAPGDPWANTLLIVGLIGGLVTAIITIFKKTAAPYTVPLYALLEGLALGGISRIFESSYPGIVNQAFMLTFGTLGGLLFAYRSGLIKPTENFKLGIFAATGGIGIIYLLSFVLGIFNVQVPLVNSNSLMGILFSLVVVVVAALNLVLDFDFIEEGAERGAPKYMEWYGAFGLLVTLIWLYLELLRLLAKLQSRRS